MNWLFRYRSFWLGITFLPLLYLGFYLPIYGDEMHWKWKTARWFVDNRLAIDVFPQCVSSFVTFPLWWFPARFLDALFYQDLIFLLKIRIVGILNCFVWLGLFWMLCRKLNEKNTSLGKNLFLGGTSLLCVGVLPLMMFLNRPEQPLLICLTGFILLSFYEAKTSVQRLVFLIIATILIELFFAQHVKALFFLPVFLVCIHFFAITTRQKLFLLVVLLFSVWTCLNFFNEITACPLNTHVRQAISGQGISLGALRDQPIDTAKHTIRNMLQSHRYLNHILFWDHYMSYWLPNLPQGLNNLDIYLNRFIRLFFWGILLLAGGSFVHLGLKWTYKTSGKTSSQPFAKARWIAGALFVSLAGMSAFQSTKASYEASVVFPCLIMMLTLVVNGKKEGSFIERFTKIASSVCIAIATLSVCRLSTHLVPFVSSQWRKGDLLSHPFSTSPFHLGAIKGKIEEVNQFCLFTPKSETHLVLDDLTYPFFSSNPEPFHVFYLKGMPEGLESFLKGRKSSGIISQCRYLTPELKSKAFQSKDEQFCCIRL